MFELAQSQRCWHRVVASVTPHFWSKLPVLSIPKRGAVSSLALADISLNVLREQNRQLQATLATIRWPPLSSFWLNRTRYTLPLKAETEWVETDVYKVAEDELAYLTGFFDGDGCVTAGALQVGQSIDGVATLIRLQEALGGSIRRLKNGRGLQKPMLNWVLTGRRACHAANLMALHSIVKRRQLEVLAALLGTAIDKVDYSIELAMLKRSESAVAGPCTWAYLAGFFDAEGYIEQPRGMALLRLRMYQKYATVLECVRTFLATEACIEAHLYQMRGRPGFELRISRKQCCKAALQKMLDAGLLRKAAQAKLALSLTSANAQQVRSAMADMVGNQSFATRLDTAGLRRAALITHMKKMAKIYERNGQTSRANTLFADAEGLQREHVLLNAQRLNDQLCGYIDKLQAMRQEHYEYKL
ncbi:unnamed protein product [Symbiodinium sp. CCMP2592]|nr:unnamed protein product [Symbiodinium sp. CCMP2592]